MGRHDYRVLLRSALLELGDFRCRDEDRALGPEERSERPEIAFVRRGAFERRLRGRDALLDAGRFAFTNAGDAYRVRHPVPGGDRCTVLRLSTALAMELRPDADPLTPFACADAPCDDALFTAQRALVSLASSSTDGTNALELEERALALCASAARAGVEPFRARADSRASVRHRELARAARELLAARFAEPLGIEFLAAALGTSPFHLCRVFRRETGSTLHGLRQALRLRAALERVAEGARDLTELALELGFASHAHLTSSFTRAFGAPPSKLRGAPAARIARASKDLEA